MAAAPPVSLAFGCVEHTPRSGEGFNTYGEAAAYFAGAEYVALTALEAKSKHATGTLARAVLAHLPSERPSQVLAHLPSSAVAEGRGGASVVLQKVRMARKERTAELWDGDDHPFFPASLLPPADDDGCGSPDGKRRRVDADAAAAPLDAWVLSPGVLRSVFHRFTPQERQAGTPGAGTSAVLSAAAAAAASEGDKHHDLVVFPARGGPDASVAYHASQASPVPLGPALLGLLLSAGDARRCVYSVVEKSKQQGGGGGGGGASSPSPTPSAKQSAVAAAAAAAAADPASALLADLKAGDEGVDDEATPAVAADAAAAASDAQVVADVRAGGVALPGGGGASAPVAVSVRFFSHADIADPALESFRDLKQKKCGFVEGAAAAGAAAPLVYAEGASTIDVVLQDKRGCLAVRELLMKPSIYAKHRSDVVGYSARRRQRDAAAEPPAVRLVDKRCLLSLLDYKTGGGQAQVATVERPATSWARDCAGGRLSRIVALDGLGNPENVGSVIRSAVCFGADAIVLSHTCCSPWGRRAVRVSMGHVFSVPVFHCGVDSADEPGAPSTLAGAIAQLREAEAFRTYAAVVQDETELMHRVKAVGGGDPAQNKWLVVVGAEHDGVSQEVRRACEWNLKIDMAQGVDSLNVSVAASILLHYFKTTLG